MIVRLFSRLIGLTLTATLTLLVVQNVGTGLAADSMRGYIQTFDAAQAGNLTQADQISHQLSVRWHALASASQDAVNSARATLKSLIP